MRRKIRMAILLLLTSQLGACVTAQTTYFRVSYQEIVSAENPKIKSYKGEPTFELVNNMESKSEELLSEGNAMLGYSQFISPLLKSLSESYATKYARIKNARHVVLEEPQPGASNLHHYLVTYWGEVIPDSFSLGVVLSELPDDLLKKMDEKMYMVIVEHTIANTAADRAGIQTGDVIFAFNGERMTRVSQVLDRIDQHKGQQVTLQLMRSGEPLDISVDLVKPVALSSKDKDIDFSIAPWTETAPTDWSSLSFASLAQANLRTWQRIEQQRQAEAERARAAAQAHLAYINSIKDNEIQANKFTIPEVGPRQWEKTMRDISAWTAKDNSRKQVQAMNIWFDNLRPMYLGSRR